MTFSMTCSTVLLSVYAECHLCWVSQISHLCWSVILLNVVMLSVVAPAVVDCLETNTLAYFGQGRRKWKLIKIDTWAPTVASPRVLFSLERVFIPGRSAPSGSASPSASSPLRLAAWQTAKPASKKHPSNWNEKYFFCPFIPGGQWYSDTSPL